jgi:hypothetical protein
MKRFAAPAVAVALAAWLSAGCRSTPPSDKAGNPDAADRPAPTDKLAKPTFADFAERIDIYMNQRRRAEAAVPDLKETVDPKKVYDREKALGESIRTVRANAPQGEIFSEAAAAEFRRIVNADFEKRTATDRAAVLEEVPARVPPRINTDYPTEMPLATFPPSLLMNLPTLPDVLEYRFLGRHLILRDVKGNVIVDYIPDAVPAAAAAAARKEQ